MKRPRGLNKPKIAPESVNLPSKHDEVDRSRRGTSSHRGVLFRCQAATGCPTVPQPPPPPPPQLLTPSRRDGCFFLWGSPLRRSTTDDDCHAAAAAAVSSVVVGFGAASTATLLLSFVLLSTAPQAQEGEYHGSRILYSVERALLTTETCQACP